MNIKDKERIKSRQRMAAEGMLYSSQRIDLLIIALCGGGIYVCLESMKYFTETGIAIHPLIKVAGGLFLLGIIFNLIGQMYGQKANCQDYLWCESLLDGDSKKTSNKFDKKSDKYSSITNWMDYISMTITGAGLTSIMYFFTFIF